VAGRGRVAEVDDDQPARVAVPTPGDEVLGAVVARPTGPLAQPPLAAAEGAIRKRAQQGLVEGFERGIAGFGWEAGEEHREMDLPALELTFVHQAGAGLRERGDGRGAFPRRFEHGRSPWLVVVLDEAHQVGLVRVAGQEVQPHLLGALVDEPVVQPLIVAEVEALLLERPLQVPVRLGHEPEFRVRLVQRTDHRRPVVVGRPGAGAFIPGTREDVVHHEHRHVAADTVALIGDLAERVHDCGTQCGRERVELHDVWPRRKIRIATERVDVPAHLDERSWIGREVGRGSLDEQLGTGARPRVVGGDVVRHEVEHEAKAAARERVASGAKTGRAAEVRVDDVFPDAIGRADHILRAVAGERFGEARAQRRVRHGDVHAGRAARPDAHEPYRVEASLGDHVPTRLGDRPEVDPTVRVGAEPFQPRPRFYLEEEWVLGRGPATDGHGRARNHRRAPRGDEGRTCR